MLLASFCRSLGQNFMLDDKVLAGIVAAADVQPGDLVLEIGPGVEREAQVYHNSICSCVLCLTLSNVLHSNLACGQARVI